MNRKTKILLIYQDVTFYKWIPPFVKTDVEILKKHFDVKTLLFNFFPFNNKKILSLPSQIRDSDVVFIWFAGSHAFFTTLLNSIFKKPIVIVTGGYDVAKIKEMKYGWMINPITKFMVKYALKHASKIIAISNFNKKEIEKNIGIKNAGLVYLSVDGNYFTPSGKKENIILAVSAVDSWNRARLKGLDMYVKVAKLLPDEKFLLIGAQKDALEKLKEISPPNVEFIPPISRDELIKYYHKAKVFCQLSYYESFGLTVAEAMSCECIPVVTRKGALPELIGDAGFSVRYGEIYETVNAIKDALNDNKVGENARKRTIANFSLENREKKLIAIIKNLLE